MRRGKWSVFAGVWMTWMGCDKVPQSFDIRIVHVGGMPYANRPVIPFASDSSPSGWWTYDEATSLGDTIWSDNHGRVTLKFPQDAWDGMLCPIGTSTESIRTFAIRFTSNQVDSIASTYYVPNAAFIRFIGNRHGAQAQSGFWLFHDWETPSIEPTRWITPGRPPSPSLLVSHWIHPEETLPAVRRHIALLPNGDIHVLPDLLIREDMIGDTTRKPLYH